MTMSTIYECIDCEQHYCAECDGGEDACPDCFTGPRCDDCATDHYSNECPHTTTCKSDDLPLCAQVMHCLCAFHARGGDVHEPCDTRED